MPPSAAAAAAAVAGIVAVCTLVKVDAFPGVVGDVVAALALVVQRGLRYHIVSDEKQDDNGGLEGGIEERSIT